MTSPPDNTPVLVGIGIATQREDDWSKGKEPLALMLDAVRAAGADSGAPDLLTALDWIGVPHGRWDYRNPGGAIARAVGANRAISVFASVGVLQQTLIGLACAGISRGESQAALVVGGDCGYRALRAAIAGATLADSQQDDAPDKHLKPKDHLFHAVERARGLAMPVGLYAIIESALRRQQGQSLASHRAQLGALYENFSEVAAKNPHAWDRARRSADDIASAGSRNPMQAFPYTRALCSALNVDQAGALLFCSVAKARALGIPPERWVFPLASTESNHQVPVSARAELTRCPGARLAGEAALAAAGLRVSEIDLLDLYSCFPAAVQVYANELGIPTERALTFTGGMSFAGGPWNNYVLQTTCRAVELLRAGQGRNAFISSVSGMLTKQGFGLYALTPPSAGFIHEEVSETTAAAQQTVEVEAQYSGPGFVAGYTVIHQRGRAPRYLALVDTPDGRRALVAGEDVEFCASMEAEEWVGRTVAVQVDRLVSRP